MNNLFVANKMAAVEIYGTCANPSGPGNMSRCGEVEIAYNIHHNIIGASILAGVDHSWFNVNDWIKVDNNIIQELPTYQWRSMLGMNLQGTMTSSVTMFDNKYPWEDTPELFGNVTGYGAQ